jgi:SAM-dependent methyltransferase
VTERSEGYANFAFAYDQALGRKFFAGVSRLLEELVERYPAASRTHLDLGCGSGRVAEWFRDCGYNSVGLDASIPMLRIARARTRRLVAADLRALPLGGRFGRITSLYDTLNHLLTPEDLERTFVQVASLMDDQSLFWFDVNHPAVYPRVWGLVDPFVSSARDHTLAIDTQFSEKTQLGVAHVSGWALVGRTKVTIDETRRQRAYSQREIESLLAKASLEPVEVIDFDPFADDVTAASEIKLFFVVRRQRG